MPAVGVTGHRVLTGVRRLRAGIDAALARIADRFDGDRWTILSALAEGADRLVVARVLARGPARLVVPLPLPAARYVEDFGSAASRREFAELLDRADEVIELPPRPTRDAAYASAGEWLVAHADVLIAVWDGRDAQGRGGTGAVVAEARQRGLPIAWVHAGNRRPGSRAPTSLGPRQGRVTFENF